MAKNILTPKTLVTVTKGVFQQKDFTWSGLCFTIGAKSPVVAQIKTALESGNVFDFGDGVVASTKWNESKYHKN